MDQARFDQLSQRHKDVLRLTYAHRTTKEMARDLSIQPGTAKGYCSEAVAILGARNRREAAIALHAFEHPPESGGPIGGFATALVPPSRWGPLDRRNREADNDFGIFSRLGWIFVLATAIAVGFGALAGGLRTLSELARAFG